MDVINGMETYPEREFIRRHHKHELVENQCSSTLVKHIKAPVHIVSLFLLSSKHALFLFSLFLSV